MGTTTTVPLADGAVVPPGLAATLGDPVTDVIENVGVTAAPFEREDDIPSRSGTHQHVSAALGDAARCGTRPLPDPDAREVVHRSLKPLR